MAGAIAPVLIDADALFLTFKICPHPSGHAVHQNRSNSATRCASLKRLVRRRVALLQGLDFDANQRIDSLRDLRHTIAVRIKVDSRERYHD